MIYNSFCVKVSMGNTIIHHERPMTLSKAEKIYWSYIKKYFRPGGPGTQIGALGDYKDELINRKVKELINFPQFLTWIPNIRCVSQQGLYTIELVHQSNS